LAAVHCHGLEHLTVDFFLNMNHEILAKALLAASKANTIKCPHCGTEFEPKSSDYKTSEETGATGNQDDSNEGAALDGAKGADALARLLISAAKRSH
jgi:hypothetical protein